jgi:hypothetical protein
VWWIEKNLYWLRTYLMAENLRIKSFFLIRKVRAACFLSSNIAGGPPKEL